MITWPISFQIARDYRALTGKPEHIREFFFVFTEYILQDVYLSQDINIIEDFICDIS